MSHLHIPDGVLPLWLIGLGWLATGMLVAGALLALRGADRGRVVPQAGVVSALVIAGMSTEIVPIAYHVNLTVLAGIVLGPWPSLIAALVINGVLALFGHGGVTVIGLNTVVIGAEMTLGWLLFQVFARVWRGRPGFAAGLATMVTLFFSTSLMIGIVALSQIDPVQARETGALDPGSLSFSNPFAGGLFANRIVTPEQEGDALASHLSLARFATVVYLLGAIGWTIEALIVGYLVAFVARVRPGLLGRLLPGGPAWT